MNAKPLGILVRRIAAPLMIVALLGGAGWAAYARLATSNAGGEEPPVYATARVVRGDIEVVVEGFGPLEPIYQADLQASAPGFIEAIYIDRGQRVEPGQIIARIRNEELGYELTQLEYDLERARLELAALLGVPPEEVTRADPTRGIRITAPIAGRISDLELTVKSEVAEGQVIARIVDDSRVVVVAELSPGEARNVANGQLAWLRAQGFDGDIRGTVTNADKTLIPKDNVFINRITIEADNPGLLAPGTVVTLRIETPEGTVHVVREQKIDRYGNETVVRSLAKGAVTQVHVKNFAKVGTGQPIVTLGGETTALSIRQKQLEIKSKELQLAQKQDIRENLVVRSPIAGVVAWVAARPGMQVAPGQPFAAVFNASKMQLFIQADEVDVVHLKDGQEAEVTVEALPGRSFPAKVVRVDMMGRAEDGIARFGVALEVEAGDELRPGMTGNVSIRVAEKRGVLLVPVEAVFEEDGKPAVEILTDQGPVTVPVEIGLVNDRVAEVVSGLEEGQVVVTGSSADRLQRKASEENEKTLFGPGGG